MRSPAALGTVVASVAVRVRPAWGAQPWAVERRRGRLAVAPPQEQWEVDRQAPAVQPAMERLERTIPL